MEVDEESIPFIFIGIFILIGNSFVCLLYHKHRVLHTAANRFVLSFAACDITIAVLFIPLYIFKSHLSSYIAALSSFGSILNLLALTYERYVAIFHALRYHEILNHKKIRLLMVEIWFTTLVITLFPLPWELTLSMPAFMKWRKVYSGILTAILTMIISITMFVYFRIFKVNRYHMKKERELMRLSVSQNGNGQRRGSKKSRGYFKSKTRKKAKGEKEESTCLSVINSNGDFVSMVVNQETCLQNNSASAKDSSKLVCCRAGIVDGASVHNIERNDNLERNISNEHNRTVHIEGIQLNQESVRRLEIESNGVCKSGVAKSSPVHVNSSQKFQTARTILREIKAARIIAVIFTLNCLCWLPIIVINFCDVMSPTGLATYISTSFIRASLYLFLLNSMVNPFIYALFKRDFRKVISRRLRMLRQRIA